MHDKFVPAVSPELIRHLRANRRDWQDKAPQANWTMDQIQRAIGANEVIQYLEELLARQMGVTDDDD